MVDWMKPADRTLVLNQKQAALTSPTPISTEFFPHDGTEGT
jgi:hypothetical protein